MIVEYVVFSAFFLWIVIINNCLAMLLLFVPTKNINTFLITILTNGHVPQLKILGQQPVFIEFVPTCFLLLWSWKQIHTVLYSSSTHMDL